MSERDERDDDVLDPTEEVGPKDCAPKKADCERGAGEDELDATESEFSWRDELDEMFQPEPMRQVPHPLDDLPTPADEHQKRVELLDALLRLDGDDRPGDRPTVPDERIGVNADATCSAT